MEYHELFDRIVNIDNTVELSKMVDESYKNKEINGTQVRELYLLMGIMVNHQMNTERRSKNEMLHQR